MSRRPSPTYQWLVVAGSKAQYKGWGTVNGSGVYGFMLSAYDDTPDRLRMKVSDAAAAWAERTARDVVEGAGHNALRIEGLSTHELLRGEAGIHRRVRPQQAAELARVTVGDEGDDGDDGGLVVRVYEEGRRRVVRDPRTRTRTADLDAVLREGRIDAFLLAMLKLRASEATPRPAEPASQAGAPESP